MKRHIDVRTLEKRIRRTERKCDIALSELRAMRRASADRELDNIVRRLHATAALLLDSARAERRDIERRNR